MTKDDLIKAMAEELTWKDIVIAQIAAWCVRLRCKLWKATGRVKWMSDYIKRSDAYNAIEKVMVNSDMPDYWYQGMTDAQYEICHVEPADVVERKRGHWITEKCDDAWGIESYMITCSECGDRFKVTEKALPYERFCRYCGSDMRGKDNE